MPPRKRRKDETDGAALAVPPKRRRADAGAKVDFEGMVFCDFSKKQWSVGASVGKGGFGEIHLTTPAGSSGSDTHVMKIVRSIIKQFMRVVHVFLLGTI